MHGQQNITTDDDAVVPEQFWRKVKFPCARHEGLWERSFGSTNF